jgi:hypothetical protein
MVSPPENRRRSSKEGARVYYEKTSRRNPQEIRLAARRIVERHRLTLYNIRDLADTYLQHGRSGIPGVLILEVADEGLGVEILPRFPECAVVIPYRIAVFVRDGKTRVATLLPETYRGVLPVPPELVGMTERMSRTFARRIKAVVRDLCARGNSTIRLTREQPA